jgi:hypothetical protein
MNSSTMGRLLVVFLMTALFAIAADIDGKWVAQVPGRDGQTREQTFTFKAEGDKLTGTVGGMRGDTQISDGKISGSDVSFVVVRQTQKGEFKQEYKGKLAGGELKLTYSFGDQSREITAKKAQ